MAFVIRPDNTVTEVFPKDPQRGWQLEELQAFVGEGTPEGRGYIELIPLRTSHSHMYGNEDAKRLGLPRNALATAMVRFPTLEEITAFVAQAREQGVNLLFDPAFLDTPDYVAGTVFVCEPSEVE
jgi:hypothetical protein